MMDTGRILQNTYNPDMQEITGNVLVGYHFTSKGSRYF